MHSIRRFGTNLLKIVTSTIIVHLMKYVSNKHKNLNEIIIQVLFYPMTTALSRKEIITKAQEDLMSIVNGHPNKLQVVKHPNYSHVYLVDESHFIFIKLIIGDKGRGYRIFNLDMACLCILWRSNKNGTLNTAFVVDAKLVSDGCNFTTAASQFSAQTASTLSNYLYECSSQSSVKHLINNIEILSNSHMRIARLAKYDTVKNLESDTLETIRQLVQGHSFWATWEGCKADCAFAPNELDTNFLGIQLKTSNYRPTLKYWRFSGCSNYNDMVVVLHALKDEPNATFCVIPGDIITTSDITIYNLHNFAWTPYLVRGDELCEFLGKLYTALLNGDESCHWPSGASHCINQMKLFSKAVLDIPVHKNGQKERAHHQRRLARFPELFYVFPLLRLPYDVLINDIKVQDKSAQVYKNKIGNKREYSTISYHTKIIKNAGIVSGIQKKKPYDDGDFDAIWFHLPNRNDFFLIPSFELKARGYLAVGQKRRGKTSIVCYLPEHQTSNGHKADTWTSKYFIADDDKALTKVQDLLNGLLSLSSDSPCES